MASLKLDLDVKQFIIKMAILKNGRAIDIETAKYYYDLDGVLITLLDKLLKRNNIDTIALNSCKIRGNAGKNTTSYKIAAAFVEGLKTG